MFDMIHVKSIMILVNSLVCKFTNLQSYNHITFNSGDWSFGNSTRHNQSQIQRSLLPRFLLGFSYFAGITCAHSVNRGALCGLQRNLIQNLHVLLMYVR